MQEGYEVGHDNRLKRMLDNQTVYRRGRGILLTRKVSLGGLLFCWLAFAAAAEGMSFYLTGITDLGTLIDSLIVSAGYLLVLSVFTGIQEICFPAE